VDIHVQVDQAKLAEIERLLAGIKNGLPTVLARAVNKTAAYGRTRIIRRLASEVGLQQKLVRRVVSLLRATYRTPAARIRIRARRMPLVWFGAKQTAKGVTFRAPAVAEWTLDYKGSKRGRLLAEHAFIARMPMRGKEQTVAHEGVYVRKGRPRLPIRELLGPSAAAVFVGVSGLADAMMTEVSQRLGLELDSQVRVLLDQEGGKVGPGEDLVSRMESATADLVPRREAA